MQKTVRFSSEVVRLAKEYETDPTHYRFSFTVVDSALVGEPEEAASASRHTIIVGATHELHFNWRLGEFAEHDLMKVLFHYATKHVGEKIRNGTLIESEELPVSMHDHPQRRCPLDIDRIPDPDDFVLEIDVEDTADGP